MQDFKLLGGTEEAATSLGLMAQGIGFPDHPVEPAVSGGAVTVKSEEVLRAASFDDQDPVGLGQIMQVTLGAPQSNSYFTVDANGLITCLIADEYAAELKFVTGREGAAGESQLYLRLLINGVQAGNSTHTIVDNARIEIPVTFTGTLNLEVGDELTLELIRDTDGDNSGGLRAGIPDVSGWAPSPSVQIIFNRNYALVTT